MAVRDIEEEYGLLRRLGAQVVFQTFDSPATLNAHSHIWIEKQQADMIWPLSVTNHSDVDVLMFPGGISSAYDDDAGASSARPVGSKGLVAESQIFNGNVPTATADPTTFNGTYRISRLVGGTGGRAHYEFPRANGEWVYAAEASVFSPGVFHFVGFTDTTDLTCSVAWLELRRA